MTKTTTQDLPTPESLRAELAELLAAGRAKLAAGRAAEARRVASAEAADRARTEAAFRPAMDAAYEYLPDCWALHTDWRKDGFTANSTAHAVRVNLPGLAPIAVRLYMATNEGEWRVEDRERRAPFLVARYQHWYGEESNSVMATAERDWTEARDAATAVALAEESEADRARLQAECDQQAAARQERQAKRAAEPAPTLDQRLAAVLAEFVRHHAPEQS